MSSRTEMSTRVTRTRKVSLIAIVCTRLFVLTEAEMVVNTRQGPVKGISTYTDTRAPILAFLGVPYAASPVGNNRFAAPQRHEGWPADSPFLANNYGPACIQPVQELQPSFGVAPRQDEDCLYLNIWTPEAALNFRSAPVVIFLEGEGFVSGYTGRFPGLDLASEGIVVVSVAYRLNVFGFLCLENSEVRGNLGLLDQYMALVWVRENIEGFGGDPRSITLMGHSAGASSIGYHMISPRTQGLFHKAILMSGTITSPWVTSSHPSNASTAIAKSLGCWRTGVKDTLKCLRSKSSEDILKAFEMQYMNGNWTHIPLPVPDDFLLEDEQYMPVTPVKALKEGLFHKIPVLTGVTSNDGAVSITQMIDLIQQGFSPLMNFFRSQVIPSIALKYNLTDSPNYKEIQTVLDWYYLDPVKLGDVTTLVSSLLNFYTDAQFKAPQDKFLQYLSNSTAMPSIYAYQFEQEENYLYKHLNVSGGGHGEELLMIFGTTLMKKIGRFRFTPAEERLSAIMKRFWVEFIRKGSLSTSPYSYGITWQRYNANERNYIIFRADNNLPATQAVMRPPMISLTKDAMVRQVAWLWNDLIPSLRDLHVNDVMTDLDPREMHLTKDVPYRSAMYTLIGFVIILLALLVICVILLKKHATERERDMF